MDVRITQAVLADALATVRPASRWHAIMPALNNVLLSTTDDRLTVSATNLEVYIERTLPQAEIAQPGAITVPLRLLAEFVRGLPDEMVRLTMNGSTLHIDSGAFEANIKGLAADEFPLIPEPADLDYITLDADTFSAMANSVASAAAKDQTRPVEDRRGGDTHGRCRRLSAPSSHRAKPFGYRASSERYRTDRRPPPNCQKRP